MGENPTSSVISAGVGSVAGSKADKYITNGLSTTVKEGTAEVVGAVGGSVASEISSGIVTEAINNAEKKDEKNKLGEILTLAFRCSLVFFVIFFIANLVGSVLVFLKLGYFEFNWKETIFTSIKKGVLIGLTLGTSLWLKARLLDRKGRRN